MPNKSNIFIRGIFLFRGYYTFFLHTLRYTDLGKNASSKAYSVQYPYTFDLFGDNRSLAFFGAAASVAALFDFGRKKC